MRSNEYPFPFLDLRNNFFIPEGQGPSNGVFQALACRQLIFSEVSIATILEENFQRLSLELAVAASS